MIRQHQHTTADGRRLKMERDMGEESREREKQRKEVLAILDIIAWAVERLRECCGAQHRE